MRSFLLVMASFALASNSALAELSVPSFFSDHMVLQRHADAAVWGNADPGSQVTVSWKGQDSKTNADDSGHWKVSLATGAADAAGAMLQITSGDETIEINDVLIGEVWFASGQSNMVFTMNRVPAYSDLIAAADHPQIRMFNAPTVTAVDPQVDIEGQWTRCSAETVGGYSAVAFFFARKLHEELQIPIGVIKSAWGGKPVETFTSRAALQTLPGTKALVEAAIHDDKTFDLAQATQSYEKRLQQWQQTDQAWREKPADQRGRRPRRPQPPKRPLDTEGKPGVLFNSMIHPFVGYTIRGAIWYQGEANAKPGAVPYDQTLPLMIGDWRSRWNDDFSFYFVQLANFRDPTTEPGDNDPWPLLQDRMRRVLDTTPKTGMAIINDVGEAKDIHPKNKHDVGERLARWALAKDYGKDLVHCGPLYQSSHAKDGMIEVHFQSVGSGLKSRDSEPLKRFEIAGKDRVWHWANAKISADDTVLVSSDEVSAPVAVRYAWAANPEGANLVNSDGLPASVFRTDDWEDAETPVANASQQQQDERRALGVKIRALAEQRAKLKRGSEEWKAATEEHQVLMKRFRELAPSAGR